jgi:hypothetical protein
MNLNNVANLVKMLMKKLYFPVEVEVRKDAVKAALDKLSIVALKWAVFGGPNISIIFSTDYAATWHPTPEGKRQLSS